MKDKTIKIDLSKIANYLKNELASNKKITILA